ncbi:Monothiol glutaredoxin-4 [Hypsizygus marmoreus]|uniref:Monothiol glutaredoxin-4 n=1 Tax=Hypsizygus marmoreus TaxID=39966 RepID=A0A369K008_HYPMA|nr:Monothiol glutaredoxin-4 [Hypsizygus marmoreus]
MASTNFYEVTSPTHFQELLSQDLSRVSLINFWAPWAAPCAQMNEVVQELAKKYPSVLVLQVEAEAQADIAESFDVEAVPLFVILKGHTLLERVSGADAPALTQALAKHAHGPSTKPLSQTDKPPAPPSNGHLSADVEKQETPEELEQRMRALMNQSTVVLFMKGSPDAPRCGFSRKITALLKENRVEFAHFDILTDENVRQGLKKLNDWPTFPQLIIKGELVGGLDIVQEMIDSGEFLEAIA